MSDIPKEPGIEGWSPFWKGLLIVAVLAGYWFGTNCDKSNFPTFYFGDAFALFGFMVILILKLLWELFVE